MSFYINDTRISISSCKAPKLDDNSKDWVKGFIKIGTDKVVAHLDSKTNVVTFEYKSDWKRCLLVGTNRRGVKYKINFFAE